MALFNFFRKSKKKKKEETLPPLPPTSIPHVISGKALLPLFLFVITFVGVGVYFTLEEVDKPFYQLSAAVAIIPAIILSVLFSKEKPTPAIKQFLEGAGHLNIITMVFIYLLAGAYSEIVEAIGGVESTVNFGLQFISGYMLLPGVFIIASFISLAMGTSMGTLAAMTPIALGIADSAGLSFPLTMGALVGGAMFGDNLSMISDTTIAAVQTQGCQMKDKFRMNFAIALPAMVITVLILANLGSAGSVQNTGSYEIIKILPYALVLALALLGVNVMIVLVLGILVAGTIGLMGVENFTMTLFAQKIYSGFSKMTEIVILSLMIGGLGELVKRQGGLKFLIKKISNLTKLFTKNDKSRIIAETELALLVSAVDACTANNTVAILISGDAASEIAKKNDIDPKRSASILDIFSCVVQGLLPYSAQILLVGSIAELSPLSIAGYNYYCLVLGAVTILSILFNYPRDIMSFLDKK